MFGFSLWDKLVPLLKKQLGKAFGPIARELRGLLNSTLNDLQAEIAAQYTSIGMVAHQVTATVKRTGVAKDPDELYVDVFPVWAIQSSTAIRDGLARRLLSNQKLNSLRTTAGVGSAQWQQVLTAYAEQVMQHAMLQVLEQMAKTGAAMWGPARVIDVAEHLAMKVKVAGKSKSEDGFHTCAVLFTKAGEGEELEGHLKRARKLWNARNSKGYDLSVREYDGFKAP